MVFLFGVPDPSIALFTHIRPLLYAAAAVAHCCVIGRDERPVKNRRLSVLLCGIGAVSYLIIGFAAGLLFGFNENRMTSGFGVVADNLWVFAAPALVSEFLRFRLVRTAPLARHGFFTTTLTLAYLFIQLDVLRGGARYEDLAGLFFVSVLPALVLNVALTYMGARGSLPSLLIIRAAYSLAPVFTPALPDVPRAAWSVISCGVLLFTLILYRLNMKGSRKTQRKARKRVKYMEKSVSVYAVAIAAIVLLTVFGMRRFAWFPSVVLTGSMTGALDRGSVVFVEKLPPEDVFGAVKEGDVILYSYNNAEMMHRVIAFRYNDAGKRVYITQGDANPAADAHPVEAEQIIGLPKSYIPTIGYPFVFVKTVSG